MTWISVFGCETNAVLYTRYFLNMSVSHYLKSVNLVDEVSLEDFNTYRISILCSVSTFEVCSCPPMRPACTTAVVGVHLRLVYSTGR